MHIYKFFCLIVVHSSMFQAFVMYNWVYQLQYSSIKFFSYNFVLNEVPNNNDVMRIANIVLNEETNSNDATYVANNVHLTAVVEQQFSIVAIQPSCRKADLQETRDNGTITRKVRVDRNKLCPEKEWMEVICLVVQAVNRLVWAGSE